jgi:ComF family protein
LKKHFDVSRILQKERCQCCGKELVCMKGKCMKCREEPVLKSTDSVLPLFSYRLWNRELMYRWKMQEERSFSPLFARLLFNVLRKTGVKVIVPVPPRKGKIRKKGWDQIEELCTFLEKRYGLRVMRLLERNTSGQQKKLSRSQRLESIKTAYSLKPFTGLLPQEVTLVDDVCTTGSTLESCAEILKSAGIEKVNAVTLFTVD